MTKKIKNKIYCDLLGEQCPALMCVGNNEIIALAKKCKHLVAEEE